MPPSSHILLSRSSSSTTVRLGSTLSVSESVACTFSCFICRPPCLPLNTCNDILHSSNLMRRCMVLQPPKNFDHQFKSDQQNPVSYPSVPASNMCTILTSWFSVKSVRCGVYYTLNENYELHYEKKKLSTLLQDYTYTCGATLSELELPDSLSSVCVCDLQCYLPEKLYFSMKYEPICINCCGNTNYVISKAQKVYNVLRLV